MALNAIESWSPAQLPVELHELLEVARQQEPDEKIREQLDKALAGNNA
ncbi:MULTISPECIES: hypothetical protein [Symbiopectobacterium]|nr:MULTISPECIES: hypothetical protein [Symbiopectobacterium]MBT9428972.1 hypothetical protein [Candidatus Symbiopectobacterium endolongispinus]